MLVETMPYPGAGRGTSAPCRSGTRWGRSGRSKEKGTAFSQFFRGGNPDFFLFSPHKSILSLTCHHSPFSLPPILSCSTRTSSPPTDHETDSGLVGLPPATLQVSARDSPAVAFTAEEEEEEEEEGETETEVGAEARERRPRPLAVRTSESCKNM